ncbi:MAG TPA: YcxB family protein [Pseudoxanthomonas sp.]|nr:YcxB family protein [Pseudoxanthomonas sp.]
MPERFQGIKEIKLSFPFTLWDRIRSGFLLMLQRKRTILFAAALPLFGLFLMLVLVTGEGIGPKDWLAIVLCLLFYPIVLVVGATAVHFGKHAREPFTYSFNDSGIHVSAASYEFTHRWSAISRVKQSGGFLMFFFSPGGAHCIPLKAVRSAGALEPLITMAKAHGARVDAA